MVHKTAMTQGEIPITPADPDSPVPLYHQVSEDLKQLIREGTLPADSVLPPEQELCLRYGVSRHTLRAAMSQLTSAELITRQAGRGTFVRSKRSRTHFVLDRSFTRQMRDMGRIPQSRLLWKSKEAPLDDRERIGGSCIHFVRLRLGDGEPIGIQHTSVSEAICPDLDRYDLNDASLYALLAEEFKVRIAEIRHTVGATAADPEQADLLEIAPYQPLLMVRTAASNDEGELTEVTTSYYRADRYEYSTSHTF